ncbi:hypothetical protein ANCCAN_30100 [Ancylostoma caninum]|uniref:Uncharacterized protein n=1 Tax=Ancylostoma caninum TaxID=29170 RepID=A0A368EZI0_ANCCA|nr:hypothetical protein ANCCAN_30100 [Ancylostoma caninum]
MIARCITDRLPQVYRRPSRECALIQMALHEAFLKMASENYGNSDIVESGRKCVL